MAEIDGKADAGRPPPLFIGFVGLCGLMILWTAWLEVAAGGNNWKQGDWLINGLEEPIRRGPAGSLILHISDMLGIGPLWVTLALQATLLLVLLTLTIVVFSPLLRHKVYFLLVFSPGFYLIFWAADVQGSLRKELISYCAMMLVVAYPLLRSRTALLVAAILFAAGCLAHEGNVFLLPALAALVIASGALREDRLASVAALAIAASGAVASVVYALIYPRVDNVASICEPLLARALAPTICDGAIGWMNRNAGDGLALAAAKLDGAILTFQFLAALTVAFAPLVYLVMLLRHPGRYLALLIGLSLPILPLFVIALDWGRWLNMQVMSGAMLLATLGLQQRLDFVRQPTRFALAFTIFAGFLLTPDHEKGLRVHGFVHQLLYLLLGYFPQAT